ncbi:hypothetical protein M2336_001811 [Sphingobium sp. B1D7B]|uniref:hypothetical protein n=1 Tax=unclassified Sphingobium TaxID=2611147 RepID=UPI0022252029|nr:MULTISPECIES: hypothetical protein [unclassified Sphingobium]MCW2393298.1 hypothetical protein [Sphingobium sp. B11D3A]MCW2405182.1 hypothetical protein [Sphingobium sp. B1D7B]
MYESDDPRSRLSTAAAGGAAPASAFGASTYARFYEEAPQETAPGLKTWLTRGQNFVVAYSQAEEGVVFDRSGQVDEYVLLLPDAQSAVTIEIDGVPHEIAGNSINFVPPGDSRITVRSAGQIVRLFSLEAQDLLARVVNPQAYAGPHPQIPPFQPWPDPVDGFKLRSYSLDVPDEPGRFGKIWRCTTFMVNVFPPQGPRDVTKLSPHHHDDFEQCSLALEGDYMHHLRWPWTANQHDWRDDEHERCGAPSVCVIPPRVIHTSAPSAPGRNVLVDIFSPPRADFSDMPGWVLNADEYPRAQ